MTAPHRASTRTTAQHSSHMQHGTAYSTAHSTVHRTARQQAWSAECGVWSMERGADSEAQNSAEAERSG
eukprot:3518742-Alexandrium_andersonii.AAC.1